MWPFKEKELNQAVMLDSDGNWRRDTKNYTYINVKGQDIKLHKALSDIVQLMDLKIDRRGNLKKGCYFVDGQLDGCVVDCEDKEYIYKYIPFSGCSVRFDVYVRVGDKYIHDPTAKPPKERKKK